MSIASLQWCPTHIARGGERLSLPKSFVPRWTRVTGRWGGTQCRPTLIREFAYGGSHGGYQGIDTDGDGIIGGSFERVAHARFVVDEVEGFGPLRARFEIDVRADDAVCGGAAFDDFVG